MAIDGSMGQDAMKVEVGRFGCSQGTLIALLERVGGVYHVKQIPLSGFLFWLFLGICPALGQEQILDRGDHVEIRLDTSFAMRVVHNDNLTPASEYQDLGAIVINCQYFCVSSGCTMGRTRVDGKTVADDSRRNGRGIAWELGADWQLVPTSALGQAENGFQGGPTLVEDGRPVVWADRENVYPNVDGAARRVGLVRTREGLTRIVVTRDAHSLWQFSKRLVDLGAWQAIDLDGGSSTFLCVRGKTLVQPQRLLPSVLAIDFPAPCSSSLSESPPRNPPTPRPSPTPDPETVENPVVVNWVEVPLRNPERGSVLWLDSDRDLEEQIQELGAVTVCSPDIFNPGSREPMGGLVDRGGSIGRHVGPAVGYAWAVGPGTLYLERCQRRHLLEGNIGGCGPLLMAKGKPVSLAEQGFSPDGGLFERDRRLALGVSTKGQLGLVGSEVPLKPEEFVAGLDGRYRDLIGLSGGPHTLLFANGRWHLQPEVGAQIPYLFAFPECDAPSPAPTTRRASSSSPARAPRTVAKTVCDPPLSFWSRLLLWCREWFAWCLS